MQMSIQPWTDGTGNGHDDEIRQNYNRSKNEDAKQLAQK